jgi:uncharacterized protein (TIGR03067 family)
MRVSGLVGLVALAVVVSLRAGEAAKLDPAKLVGTWNYVSGERDGKKVPQDHFKGGSVDITKKNITLNSPDGKYVIKYRLDPSKTPCRIDLEIIEGPQGQGAKANGIIELKGGQLRLCYPAMGGAAPKEFAAAEGSKLHLFVLKRKK